MVRRLAITVPALLSAMAFDVHASELALGDVSLNLRNRYSTAVAVRTDPRDPRLIGKLNIPGQQTLCQADDCLSITGDPEPNLRLVKAAGAFSGINGDNGNLNYPQWSIVAATNELRSDAQLSWKDLLLRVSGVAYLDPSNINFDETHTNTLYQPEKTARPGYVTRAFASGAQLLNASLLYSFTLADHAGSIVVGSDTVHWGENTFVALNSLNEINPINAALLRMPGGDISDIFRPVPMVRLSMDIADGLSTELLYQLAWVPLRPNPPGSFYSSSDVLGGGNTIVEGLGQYAEDPNRQYIPPAPLSLLTSSTRTAHVLPEDYGRPPDSGQFGARLSYFMSELNGGTQLDLYFLNYHSRSPYIGVIAADESCLKGVTNIISGAFACRGFNGTLSPPGGLEPLPIDSLQFFFEYPTDIQMYGISFDTSVGAWSLSGEFSFRPNVPVQIHQSDLVFAGLQPAFPDQDIPLDPLGISFPGYSLLNAVIPGKRTAAPDYVSGYRGITVQPHQRISGYERLQVGQMDITGLRSYSANNPLGADQILLITELGFTQLFNMPDRSVLQFEGGSPNDTHASPGSDGTGSGGITNSLRLNPTQQTQGFASSFSWGIRIGTQLTYNKVFMGWNLTPMAAVFRDITGIAPLQFQNFSSGNTQFNTGVRLDFNAAVSTKLMYQAYTGGGTNNRLRDRDNLALSLAFSF